MHINVINTIGAVGASSCTTHDGRSPEDLAFAWNPEPDRPKTRKHYGFRRSGNPVSHLDAIIFSYYAPLSPQFQLVLYFIYY